ncbi:hypothetical protein EZV73_12790 [Acidaminobacter sp. JC074]|uniref:hypothetical protein n=1 Tax=Acidaminobacter sp. JC074 TaxID=2530199 RepID=UPI001F0E0FD0|nr:hypothetical protein [Acidaminobacter sp. JC074]MCH4888461.1 hypothetical protein [Acidaminobacter sp. JC074]
MEKRYMLKLKLLLYILYDRQEINEIVEDYKSIFKESKEEGLSDIQVISNLGRPVKAFQNITSENLFSLLRLRLWKLFAYLISFILGGSFLYSVEGSMDLHILAIVFPLVSSILLMSVLDLHNRRVGRLFWSVPILNIIIILFMSYNAFRYSSDPYIFAHLTEQPWIWLFNGPLQIFIFYMNLFYILYYVYLNKGLYIPICVGSMYSVLYLFRNLTDRLDPRNFHLLVMASVIPLILGIIISMVSKKVIK